MRNIYSEDGRLIGKAVVDTSDPVDNWYIASIINSSWVEPLDRNSTPYIGEGTIFLVKKIGRKYTLLNTIASVEAN